MPLTNSFSRLRRCAFVGQVAVLFAVVHYFSLSIDWPKILALLLLIPFTELAVSLGAFRGYTEKSTVGLLLILDTIILTSIICMAGGPTNPFTIVYFLHVVISAVLLTPIWTWGIAGLSCVCFSLLFIFGQTIPEWEVHGAHQGFSLHLHGMLLAYVVVALLAAYFLSKLIRDRQANERKLQRLELLASNQQRLATLTTITAGAAHELGTPLGTIAVISHELERVLKSYGANHTLLEDISLLKEETARCKRILQELASKSGELSGEPLQATPLDELINNATFELPFQTRIEIANSANPNLIIPRKALTTALHALVKNASEAAVSETHLVEIYAHIAQELVTIKIVDSGQGMNDEILERVGEPFFSTKQPGMGMGLGVYLSKLTLEQLGGKLTFTSSIGRGTTVEMVFPADCSSNRMAA